MDLLLNAEAASECAVATLLVLVKIEDLALVLVNDRKGDRVTVRIGDPASAGIETTRASAKTESLAIADLDGMIRAANLLGCTVDEGKRS